ncbi:MAG: hypothetical protein RR769_05275 [Anaerovoracaceae bacterium]
MEEEQAMIVIQDDFRVKVSTAGTEELFNLERNPEETSLFVQEVKRKLMSSLDLKVVVDNLYNTADLLYVSYNALEGTTAKPLVSGLQVDLANLCGKSQVAMVEINNNTSQMLGILPTVYNMLVMGEAKGALKILAKASSNAGNMAKAADGLANQVDGMIEKAKTALISSEGLYAQDVQKKADFARKLEDMQAEKESLSQQAEEMQGIIEELQSACIEAKQREDKAEKRAFTMGIISSVTGLFDLGIGEAIGSLTPKQEEHSEEHAEEAEKNKQSQKENETKIKELEKNMKELKEKQKSETLSEEDKKKLTEELKELQKQMDTLQKDNKTLTTALNISGKIAGEISGKTKKAQSEAQSVADKASERTMELQKQKLEMQKGQIKLKGDLTKLAHQVKEQVNENMTLDTAIKMLQLALQCLGHIVVALQTTAIFWRGIESGCKSLAQDTLVTLVDGLQEADEEFQRKMYLKDSFMGQMLSYMSTWVALNMISREYAEASFKAGETVRFNVKHPKFGNDAYSTARQLADDILSRME